MKKLVGTGVALVTPMDKEGRIDYDGFLRLLDYTASEGVDYYVVMGTTGESATMTNAEKIEILDFVKNNNKAGLPIVYGIGGNNTAELLETISNTDFQGVDAVLSVSPYYNKPSQEGIYKHYIALADASPVPIILYNVPGRTGSNITAKTTLRLSKHDNIIGIKEASGLVEQAMEISHKKPTDFMLISGDDLLTLPLISVGALGVISVLANPFAGIFKTIFTAVESGDLLTAQHAAFKLLEVNPLMYEEGNPVGVKVVLNQLGICDQNVRLPLTPASEDLKKRIKLAVDNM